MTEARINEITVLCGRRGTGKTTMQQKILDVNPKKTLIVDTFDHPAWRHVPIVEIEQLQYWKKGTYRVILQDFSTDLISIGNHVGNCNIVYEDAKKYFRNTIPAEVERVIIDSKQKNIDVYFMFHMLSEVPKYLRQMYDNLILFKTKDAPDVYKRFSNYLEIETVHKRVLNHKSKYYCERIKE